MRRSTPHTDLGARAGPAHRGPAVAHPLPIAALGSVAFLVSLAATLPARIAAGYAALSEEINGYS